MVRQALSAGQKRRRREPITQSQPIATTSHIPDIRSPTERSEFETGSSISAGSVKAVDAASALTSGEKKLD